MFSFPPGFPGEDRLAGERNPGAQAGSRVSARGLFRSAAGAPHILWRTSRSARAMTHIRESANSAWVPRQCGTRPIGRKDRPRIVMEGPLVSDTTEFLSGATDASGETPLGRPASAGDTGPEGSHAGSSAPAGSDGAAAATGRRRQGTGLSALRLPELQQVAHQMGIAGTARMRKSQLIAAIQEKQGGGAATEPRRSSAPSADRPAAAAASSEVGTAAAGSEVSAPRAASAGADASPPAQAGRHGDTNIHGYRQPQ